MSRGYTLHLHGLNKRADGNNIGVRLGRLCIKKDISAAEVAEALGVTRATVYNWFTGGSSPLEETVPLIENYIAKIS